MWVESLRMRPAILVVGHTRAAGRALARRRGAVDAVLLERPEEMPGPSEREAYAATYPWDYVQENSAAVLESIKKTFQPQAVIPLREHAVIAAGELREGLGLPGPGRHAAVLARDKSRMKEAFAAAGLPIAPWRMAEADQSIGPWDELGWPLVIKPVAMSGSAGVTVAANAQESAQALNYVFRVSKETSAIVERCVHYAREVSVDGVVWKGELIYSQVTDKATTGPPHFVEVGHVVPSRLGGETKKRCVALARRALTALRQDDTIFCAEMFILPTGDLVMGELAARQPGDRLAELGQLATGYDMVGALLDISMHGSTCESVSRRRAASIRYMNPGRAGTLGVVRTSLAKRIPGVVEVCVTFPPDRAVGPLRRSADRPGYAIATGNRPTAASLKAQLAVALMTRSVKGRV